MGSRGQNFGVKPHISTPEPKLGVQMFTVPHAKMFVQEDESETR